MTDNLPALQTQQGLSWDTPKGIATITATVAKGATEHELAMFLEVCRGTGLNPFLKEIWFVATTKTIMAGRDGYLRKANEHPQFDGMETTVERDDKNLPIKATCKVWRKDRSHPITCEAYFSEYKKNSPVWTQYPSAMISKVAEVLALKRSFAINGVVTEEEIGYTTSPQVERQEAEEVDEEKAKLLDQLDSFLNGSNFSEAQKIKTKKATAKMNHLELKNYIEKLKENNSQEGDNKLNAIIEYLTNSFDNKADRQAWLRSNTEGFIGSLVMLKASPEHIESLYLKVATPPAVSELTTAQSGMLKELEARLSEKFNGDLIEIADWIGLGTNGEISSFEQLAEHPELIESLYKK